jgi:DNA-directed RNA polymerase alpha subunit
MIIWNIEKGILIMDAQSGEFYEREWRREKALRERVEEDYRTLRARVERFFTQNESNLKTIQGATEEIVEIISKDSLSPLDELLSQPIELLNFGTRVSNIMNCASLTLVGDIARKSEDELFKYRNFGRKSLREVTDKLRDQGLSVNMKVPVGPREREAVLRGPF